MTVWAAIWDDIEEEEDPPQKQHGNRGLGGYQCLCGRFAKYLGGHNYYNGNYTCYSYDVDCSRCGVVTVQCV